MAGEADLHGAAALEDAQHMVPREQLGRGSAGAWGSVLWLGSHNEFDLSRSSGERRARLELRARRPRRVVLQPACSPFTQLQQKKPRQSTAQNVTDPNSTPVAGGDFVVAKVGSQATADELSASFKHGVIKEVNLPEGGIAGSQHIKLCLTAAVGADKANRVWFHNTHVKSVSLPAGTFLGRGGQGNFVSLVKGTMPEDKLSFCLEVHKAHGAQHKTTHLSPMGT